MEYRRVGRSGLKVSVVAFGTASYPPGTRSAREFLAVALDAGVNFFDVAEVYLDGDAERRLGEALQSVKWPRIKYVIATKFGVGLSKGPNAENTLNRKYLMDAIDGSLKRLRLDYVDIAYCHCPDPETPLEETVWAMHNIIESGKALYWGTSNFSAEQIRAAWEIAKRHHLHKPIVEQAEYNLLHRKQVERELGRPTEDLGLGIVAYSPLAGGLLTGKYRDGIPADSRAVTGPVAYRTSLVDTHRNEIVANLSAIAAENGMSLAQLSIAWCLTNPQVCSVALGASRLNQLTDNLKAMDVLPNLTTELQARLRGAIAEYDVSWRPI